MEISYPTDSGNKKAAPKESGENQGFLQGPLKMNYPSRNTMKPTHHE